MAVKFSILQGARGLRAYNVTVLGSQPSTAPAIFYDMQGDLQVKPRHDCRHRSELSVAWRRSYESLIAAVLMSTVPEITAEQITQVCERLMQRGAVPKMASLTS